MEKICKYCNIKFTTTHANKNHCSSNNCKMKYHHERSYIVSICPICNISFEHRKSKPKTYCSKKCAQSSPEVITKMIESQKKTYMEKYGVDHPMKTSNTKNNLKNTLLEIYGTEHALQNEELLQKQKDTIKKIYSVENVFQSDIMKYKIRSTKLKKYGDKNYRNNIKRENTTLQKYGNKCYSKTGDFKKKMNDSTLIKLKNKLNEKNLLLVNESEFDGINTEYEFVCKICGNKFNSIITDSNDIIDCKICFPIYDKVKKTKLKKYGNEFYNNIDKIVDTNIKRYGKSHYTKTDEYKKYKYNVTYDNLINSDKFIDISPDFTKDEFKGVNIRGQYTFICNSCAYKFVSYLNNGNIPKCPKCNNNTNSKYELEILDYIKSLNKNINVIEHDRTLLNGKEIDFYFPDYNFAIEFNGIYYHTETSGNKNRHYHLNKTKVLEAKGISLIHIFENEWIFKNDIVKSILNYKFNLSRKLYARKCYVSPIDSKLCSNFLNKTHLQGRDTSSVKLGLFYTETNELISVMTFCKSRYNKNIQWEISRYAIKLNIHIIGGISKLFSYFIKNYNPNSIITYSDRRYFNGNSYKNIGFNFIENTTPNYFYVDYKNMKLLSRLGFQKHKLSSILSKYDKELSEWENMKINGFDRIWDCGNKKFIWNKTK